MYQCNNSSYSRVGIEVGGLCMFEFSLYGLIFFNVFNYSMYNYKLIHLKNKFKNIYHLVLQWRLKWDNDYKSHCLPQKNALLHCSLSLYTLHCLWNNHSTHFFFFGGLRKDGGVEGLEVALSHKNTKVTTSCWMAIYQKDSNLPEGMLHIQRQTRSRNKMAGGVHSQYTQISYSPGEWPTLENNYITEALP